MTPAERKAVAREGGRQVSHASEVRARKLKVGDTIEGRETWDTGWHEAQLTLLWIGETEACWKCRFRSHIMPAWTDWEEDCNWTLECRDWKKVTIPTAAAMVEAGDGA